MRTLLWSKVSLTSNKSSNILMKDDKPSQLIWLTKKALADVIEVGVQPKDVVGPRVLLGAVCGMFPSCPCPVLLLSSKHGGRLVHSLPPYRARLSTSSLPPAAAALVDLTQSSHRRCRFRLTRRNCRSFPYIGHKERPGRSFRLRRTTDVVPHLRQVPSLYVPFFFCARCVRQAKKLG